MAKSAMFHVRVSEAERNALDALAAREGLKPGALLRRAVRQMIAAPDMVAEDRAQLWEAIRVMRGAAGDLNQIAKAARRLPSEIDGEALKVVTELKATSRALQSAWVAYQRAERERSAKLVSPDLEEAP